MDFDSLLIGVIEPSYQSKIDFEKNNLQSEYFSIISSLKASFSYSLPYSKYDKRPNNLEITFKSEIVNLPLNNGSVYLKYFGKSNEYFFNSSGKILFNINDSVRSKETVDLEILLNLNKLLEDHNLFKIKKLNNPKYNFVISDEPLVFHYEDNFDDEELSKFLYKNFKINIFGKININLIENENAPYKIEIEASDLTKNFNEQTKQYFYNLVSIFKRPNIQCFFNKIFYSKEGNKFLNI